MAEARATASSPTSAMPMCSYMWWMPVDELIKMETPLSMGRKVCIDMSMCEYIKMFVFIHMFTACVCLYIREYLHLNICMYFYIVIIRIIINSFTYVFEFIVNIF